MSEDFKKREIALRNWLQGMQFFTALRAMQFAKGLHTGVRKDGVTPEFDHQVSIGNYIRTLHQSLEYPEATLAAVMLHDTREDFGVSDGELRSPFGDLIADAVIPLTKEFRGIRRDEAETFDMIARNPISSPVKGGDRINNQDTMIGVFSDAKQEEYIEETTTHFFPMLKLARRLFPRQEPAYENIRGVLRSQVKLIEAVHAAKVVSADHDAAAMPGM